MSDSTELTVLSTYARSLRSICADLSLPQVLITEGEILRDEVVQTSSLPRRKPRINDTKITGPLSYPFAARTSIWAFFLSCIGVETLFRRHGDLQKIRKFVIDESVLAFPAGHLFMPFSGARADRELMRDAYFKPHQLVPSLSNSSQDDLHKFCEAN